MTEHGIASPAAPPDTGPDPRRAAGVGGAGLLALLSLGWLIATVWSAHASITSATADTSDTADAATAVGSAALALPGVIAASLLAGAATGLATVVRFGAATGRTPRRALLGCAAATIPGFACAGAVLLRYGTTSSVAVLALTVAVAGVLGGAAAVVPPGTLSAGVSATLAVFVVGAVVNLFQSPLKSFFGAAHTIASQVSAARSLSLATAVVSGVAAGLVAYLVLRRGRPSALWPAYLVGGLVPGLLLLLAEGLTRVGGSGLLNLVGDLSPADRAVLTYLDSSRISHALVVTFVGAIVAMVAVGRTLGRPDEAPAQPIS